MALYKGPGPGADAGLRIDGQVWSASGPGATVRGWAYPTMHRSAQFNSFDAAARTLDESWDALTPAQQVGWTALGAAGRIRLGCPWYFPQPIYYFAGVDGQEAFAAVNLAHQLQGIPWTDIAPEPKTYERNDSVTLLQEPYLPPPPYPLARHVRGLWQRDGRPGGESHCCMIWQRPRQTARTGAGSQRKYRFIGTIPLVLGGGNYFDDPLSSGRMVTPGGMIDLLLGLAEVGMPPFAAVQTQVRND